MEKRKPARFLSPEDAERSLGDLWHEGVRGNPGRATAAALADEIGCGVSMVYRYGEDHVETMSRAINGVVAMATLGRDYRIAQRIAERIGMRLVPVGEAKADGGTLLTGGAEAMREVSDVLAAISESIADGEVTADEAARIRKEANEAIVKLEQLSASADNAANGGAA